MARPEIFLTVVVPIYNEEKSLVSVFSAIKEALQKTSKAYEIIAINDGSVDSSLQVLRKIRGVIVLSHAENHGYGFAIKKGIRQARGEWVCIIDADKTYPAEKLPEMLEYCGEYDMVVGARTKKSSSTPLSRRPAKFLLSLLANYVSGVFIPDMNSGFRIFNKKKAQQFFYLLSDRFSFTTTITLAFLTSNYPTRFVEIDYFEREGKSKIRPRHFVDFIVLILKTILFFKPLRIFVPLALLFFLAAVGLAYYSVFVAKRLMDTSIIVLLFMAINTFFFGLQISMINKIRNR